MPVAKSYQNANIVSDIYTKNGRSYVQIESKNGPREVRWYSDAEYQRLYPGAKIDHSKDPFWRSQKDTLGFKNGYIWIFTGNTYDNKEWFKEHDCRYTKHWGWGWSSENEAPKEEELPEGIKMIKLPWEVIGTGDKLNSDEQIAAAMEFVLYEPGTSEYIYEVGAKITALNLVVTKNVPLESYYGLSHMHIMEDEAGNVYVWTTQAKDWEEGSEHCISGTVKDHRTYHNVKQTVLTRCREVA